MTLFDCQEKEIRLLKRLRTLEAAGIDRTLIGLKPLAILEKIDGRVEFIEPAAPPQPPPLTPAR